MSLTLLLRQLDRDPEALRDQIAVEYPFAAVAEAVLEVRRRHSLTQAELARRVGTSQSVIARLEGGKHPAEVTLLNRIAEAVG